MITYPTFSAVLADTDRDALAERSGVPTHILDEIAGGTWFPVSLGMQFRLARAMGANPIELFRTTDDLERGLDSREAQGFSRYVDDPAALRAVDAR